MQPVNMLQAKTHLSRLVEAIENGEESEVVIARNGRPVARLVPVTVNTPIERRLGAARGAFQVPVDIDAHNNEVAHIFLSGDRA